MKLAIIADIHGNAPALDAVAADITLESPDQIICLGDLVNLGPSSAEVIERILDLKVTCLRGNHEEAVLDSAQAANFGIAPHLMSTLDWTNW